MATKELMHIVRDPQILVFALGMPLLLILLFGYGVSFDVERLPLVVVDQDHTAQSRALVRAFSASGTFEVVATREAALEVETLFRSASAKAALVVPEGFAKAKLKGTEAKAQLLVDGSDNSTASIALGYARSVALAETQRAVQAAYGINPPLQATVRTLFNPGLRSAVFLVPGLVVVVLVIIAVMLTALTVAREYERGSMEQLFATPVGRLEVILGKLAPYFGIGQIQVLLVLTLGVSLFDVPFRGSLWLVFLSASLFLLAMLMQGLLISVVTRNQMVAAQIAAVSTFLPALLLSGFIFPIDAMPLPLQAIATVLPPRYLVHALRAILLRGNGLDVIWPDLIAMGGFFLVLLTIATARFQRTLA